MKKELIVGGMLFFIFLSTLPAHSAFDPDDHYTGEMEVFVRPREIEVKAKLTFHQQTAVIKLPRLANLKSISSPSNSSVGFVKEDERTLSLVRLLDLYGGQIELHYSLLIQPLDNPVADWYPQVDSSGIMSVRMSVPEGYTGLFLPYDDETRQGFILRSEQKPVLLCGQYQIAQATVSAKQSVAVYYQHRLFTPAATIVQYLKFYQTILPALSQSKIIILQSPSLGNSVHFSSGKIFVTVNNTLSDEIKKSLVGIWFEGMMNLSGDYLFAFKDLYSRLVNSKSGEMEQDAALLVPVPSDQYYFNVISEGFSSADLSCDVDSMIKNFALLHYAYYTVGMERFIKGVSAWITAKGKFDDLARFMPETPVTGFAFSQLLPVARYAPDVYVENGAVIRNSAAIPDVSIKVGEEIRPLAWGTSKKLSFNTSTAPVIIDPDNTVPQLNFYNDAFYPSGAQADEWNKVYQTVISHRHFPNERFRELLNIEKFAAPAGNAFRLPANSTCYIAVVKFLAPVHGRLQNGLKELVIYWSDGKPAVVYDRIRAQ